MNGTFYGVGVGPGDSELLTVKAVRLLNEVDIIIAPVKKIGKQSIALDIAMPHLSDDAKIMNLVFPMIYNADELTEQWIKNASIIERELKKGKNIAFITLGDPMLYSTYMYVMELLVKKEIKVETIPGINSFSAIASICGVPLTAGNETLTVIPLRKDCTRVKKALEEFDNIIVMKPSGASKELAQLLIEHKLENNFVMVSKASQDKEEISYDITKLQDGDIPYLTTILIKKNGLK